LRRFVLLIFVFIFGCSGVNKFKKPVPTPYDRYNIPQPREYEKNILAEYFDKQITEQLRQSLDFSRQLRNMFGKPKQALNITAFDEVPNSSWFTNRNSSKQMSIGEIIRGPNQSMGPDTSESWTIVAAKVQGVTPGFSIKDANGDLYLIKFDPIGFPELASGAEVISSLLFYAAGYNVPENYVTYFHPNILKLGEGVKFTDEKGRKRFMVQEDLDKIFKKIEFLPDGRIRAMASKLLPGTPIGPFSYKETRKDDPNDVIPHHHRRELRGLYVLAAWLNHFDTKDGNTLDMYIKDKEDSYVKHYLIDFGATLGSASHSPNHPWRGHQNDFDPHEISKNLLAFGFYVRPWEKQKGVFYPSIGLYESELFQPCKYKPQVPNPAFENCTNLDGFWGTKIVMSFTDEQIKAVVKQAQHSNLVAKTYLVNTIIERRDKIGKYWFNKINPLDKFNISKNNQNLNFIDLGIETNLWSKESTNYFYILLFNGKIILNSVDLGNQTSIPLQKIIESVEQKISPEDQFEIEIRTKRENEKLSKWVKVYFTFDETSNRFQLLGLKRQN